MQYTISDGFADELKAHAAKMFWNAFKGKLHPVMRPQAKALAFFQLIANPTHAISAYAEDGSLIGLAGFATKEGAFMAGTIGQMCAIYGYFGGIWRGLFLSILERPQKPKTLLMDGIFVDATARGQGVGSALIAAIKKKARTLGCTSVRLDVIDTNPRAKALYERQGFIAQGTTDIGPFRHIFGFKKSTTMVFTLND